MTIKAILFDLDGTLLPMDADAFVKTYFGLLAAKAAPLGYEPKALVDAVMSGTKAMAMNDGTKTNEAAFWDKFAEIFGEESRAHQSAFDDFYRVEFNQTQEHCFPTEKARKAVEIAKSRRFRVALATNPVFPATATLSRIRWAGFEPDDFELYTTYEMFNAAKPNPKYFVEFARRMGLEPSECAMVGNDATEDMAAAKAGMTVFLLTESLLNRENRDLSGVPHGSFEDLFKFIETLAEENRSGEV